MVSHGSAYKTLGDPLLSAMAKQTGITKKSFLELVDCTLDQVGYEALAFPKSLKASEATLDGRQILDFKGKKT